MFDKRIRRTVALDSLCLCPWVCTKHECGDCEYSANNPPLKTHTCYYCNHEGPCVNRIHSTEFMAWGRTQEIRYVCDDGITCDERWQALETDKAWESLEQKIYAIIEEEALNHVTNEKIATGSTNRIMKLIELPF